LENRCGQPREMQNVRVLKTGSAATLIVAMWIALAACHQSAHDAEATISFMQSAQNGVSEIGMSTVGSVRAQCLPHQFEFEGHGRIDTRNRARSCRSGDIGPRLASPGSRSR
jgi:hypothetical protein